MARYIDTDEFVKRVIQYPRQSTKTIGLALADTPTADVVEQSVVDQIRWERDTAIAQLAEIGKGFGETMDDVVEVVRGTWTEKEVIHRDEAKEIVEAWQSCRCSVCDRYDTRPYMYYFDKPNFCSWCGADMRERREDG